MNEITGSSNVPSADTRDAHSLSVEEIARRATAVSAAVTRAMPLEAKLEMIGQAIAELAGFASGDVVLYDQDRDELCLYRTLREGGRSIRRCLRRPAARCRSTACVTAFEGRQAVLIVNPVCDLWCKDGVPGLHALAPLVAGDVLVGFVGVTAHRGSSIASEQLERLSLAAGLFAGTVYLARQLEDQQSRLRMTRSLTHLGAAIAAETDLDTLLRMVRDAIVDVGVVDRAAVFLMDPTTGHLVGSWGTTRDGELEDLHERVLDPMAVPDAPSYRVVSGELPYVVTPDLTASMGFDPDNRMYGVRYHCAIPLRAGDEIVGILNGDNLLSDRPITENDVGILQAFARLAAVAIVNARLQTELRMYSNQLEEEVRRRTEEAQALSGEVSALVHSVGHDLRSPIRAIEGFTQAILEEHGHELTPPVRRDLERIEKAVVRLGELLDALLAVGRLSRSKPNLVLVQPARVVEAVVAELRPRYHHPCHIEIQQNMPAMLADEHLIRLLYRELVANALRATSARHAAEIHVGYADGAYFVQDNGVGFEQQYAHTLFDLFRRYDYRSDSIGSGLATVRRIVELHGGTVTAEGKPGQGATFRFTIGAHRRGTASPYAVLSHTESEPLLPGQDLGK